MKTASIQNRPTAPSPFQITVLPEDFALPSVSAAAPPSNRTPFADLMLHPEKLEAALKIARSENDAFGAARKFGLNDAKRAASDSSSRSNGARKSSSRLRAGSKMTEFHLKAPAAMSVKLAADFTDWEKFPLDMIKAEDGVWSIFVPLLPGDYSYRFIVDGKWRDDPRADSYKSNPFGAANAVVKVT